MSKKKRFISLILAFVLIFCSFSVSYVTLAAGEAPKVDGSGASVQGGGIKSGPGTMTIVNGASYKKSGYLFYILSKDGAVVKTPKAYTTFGDVKPSGSHLKYLDTRYGGMSVSSIESGSMQDCPFWWGLPPFNSDGSGNGGKIKQWLLTKTANGSINGLMFIMNMWDFPTAQKFVAEEQYLIIEAFSWSGLYKGKEHKKDVIATALGWANVREAAGYGVSGLETRYSLGVLPNSMCYDIPVLGVPAAHDIYDKHTPAEIQSAGFGVGALWANELLEEKPNPPVLTPPTTDDYLKANELNYVFPDFKEDTNDMRTADTYTAKYNMTPESVWKKHPDGDREEDGVKYTFEGDKIQDGKWYIVETITSSIKTKIGLTNALLYRSGAGLYFASNNAENLKTINCGEDGTADSADRYPGYAFDLTRTTFGDNIVISEFTTRGDNQSMKNHFKNELKFAVGHDGVKSNIIMTDNVEGKANNSLSDTHVFEAKITEYYKRKPWTWVEATYKTDANG